MCLVSASVSENDVFQSLVVYTNITFVFFSLHSLSLSGREPKSPAPTVQGFDLASMEGTWYVPLRDAQLFSSLI